MRDTIYCLDCEKRSYSEHAQMTFCKHNGQPAWMALDEFWDSELGKCIHRKVYEEKWGKARKKPVEVEFREPREPFEIISTPEGDMVATPGKSLVIKGVEDELYPILIDIFKKTYDVTQDCAALRREPE